MPSTSVRKQTGKSELKAKTGCLTCKIRRVKCDEAKPHCLRCTSTGRKCDGYPQQRTNHNTNVSVAVTPKQWGNRDSVQHLEFYYYCAASTVSSYFDADFWSRTVLQMAHSEPAVRHALMALGYLFRSEPGGLKPATAEVMTSNRTDVILFRHYNTAIRRLVGRMAEPSYTPEIGLVTCILFICLEYLRGNYRTAFAHLDSGLGIIAERRKKTLKLGQRNPRLSHEQVQIRPNPSSSIEDDIQPMFIRMIAGCLTVGHRPALFDSVTGIYPPSYQRQTFTELRDAHHSMLDLRNLSLLFMGNIGDYPHTLPIGPEDIHYQGYLRTCLKSWHDALNTFEEDRDRATNPARQLSRGDKVAISSLRMVFHLLFIALSCCFDASQMMFDEYITDFQTIIHHAHIVMDVILPNRNDDSNPSRRRSSPVANFTFEDNVIAPLFFVACRCRCPRTRREAISLLGRNPPREGLMDANMHRQIAELCVGMEETEVDPVTGWPVQRTRLPLPNTAQLPPYLQRSYCDDQLPFSLLDDIRTHPLYYKNISNSTT